MASFSIDSLQVRQFPDRAAAAAAAAELAAAWIGEACAERGEARVVFACAPSQTEFLAALRQRAIEWTRLIVFHMDEYAGLDDQHPQSFRRYLREHLLDHVSPPKEVHLIAGDAEPVSECRRYAALLAEKQIDVVCMGIGENGHIAFNDPPVANFHDPNLVKVVELDRACRQQQVNDGCFATFDAVPARALTLTIPALLGARAISCVVPGERKARAVRATLLGAISPACPASILRTHPRAILHLDEAAASLLSK
jgi:glucosamine-6-phosphate deaminase